MNFAKQLINWRTNNHLVQDCEKHIKDTINAKTSFIIYKLKDETKEGDIGVYVFDATEFFKMLINYAQYEYKKTCYISSLELHLINAFSLENNITVIKDFLNKNCFYIFFNNGASRDDETASIRLAKAWFSSYVLKDFEKEYKELNNKAVRFTNSFQAEYTYLPISKALTVLTSHNPLKFDYAIYEELTKLAKENGLSIEKTQNFGFILGI